MTIVIVWVQIAKDTITTVESEKFNTLTKWKYICDKKTIQLTLTTKQLEVAREALEYFANSITAEKQKDNTYSYSVNHLLNSGQWFDYIEKAKQALRQIDEIGKE